MANQRRPPFTKRLLPLAALVLLAAVLPLGSAAAQPAPQQTTFNVPFRAVAAPGTSFDLVQSVIDYNAGAKVSASTANVSNYLTVLEGELTVQVADKSEVVAKGKGLSVSAGAALALSNTSSAKARLFVSTLLPVAVVANVHQPNSSGVTLVSTARRTISNAPPTVDVIQVWTQYDAGFRTGNHMMNELHLFTMLAGITDFGYLDHSGVDRFRAGQQAVMHEGMAGWMGNTAADKSSFALTWIGTPGKPLTSAVAVPAAAATPVAVAPGPPRTGSGLAQGDEPRQIGPGLAIGSAGFALLTLSVLALYASRRARRRS